AARPARRRRAAGPRGVETGRGQQRGDRRQARLRGAHGRAAAVGDPPRVGGGGAVMSEPAPERGQAPPVAAGPQADALCLRYEADWKAGRSPHVTDYLEGLEGEARALLLEELRALERAYLHGGTVSLEAGPERQTPVRAAEETAPGAAAEWRGVLGPAQQPGELGRLGPYPVLRPLGRGGRGPGLG